MRFGKVVVLGHLTGVPRRSLFRAAKTIRTRPLCSELLNEHLSGAATTRKTSYELAREFGLVAGLKGAASDLAENRKQYLTQKPRAKRLR